jgi:hypothetical protein
LRNCYNGKTDSSQLSKSLGLLVALLSAVAFAVHPVDVRGQDFVDTVSNKRVMIIGVD